MSTSLDLNSFFSDDSPSASKIAGSCDLLSEILSRVPTISLFRFKCVSQNWRSLISNDHRLAQLHTKRNPLRNCSGLFSSTSSSTAANERKKNDFFWLNDRLKFPPPPPALSYLESLSCSRILQSSNGLLLCSSSRSDCAYFVCNPVVGQFCRLDLPAEVGSEANWEVLGLTLAFDPSLFVGFKVICFMSRAIDVYSSCTGNWNRLYQGRPIRDLNLAFENGVYWKGKAFWLRKQSSIFHQIELPIYCILNLENELFDVEHTLPCSFSMVRYFGESLGKLHLVTKDHESFNLFEMGENHEWMLKFKVMEIVMRRRLSEAGLSEISDHVWGGSFVLNVVRKTEQEEDGYLVLWYLPSGGGRVVSYNCKTKLVSCISESKAPALPLQASRLSPLCSSSSSGMASIASSSTTFLPKNDAALSSFSMLSASSPSNLRLQDQKESTTH